MTRVAFLVQSLRLSGGHQVVVEHALQLADRHGFDVTLVVTHHQGEAPWSYEGLSRLRVVDVDELGGDTFDLAVATWWDTIRFLDRVPAKRFAYFVQSLEDRFSEEDAAERHLAALTYQLGLPVVTEARWIARLLHQIDPDTPCHLVRNGINKTVFPVADAAPVRTDGALAVLVEGNADWLKGLPEAVQALQRTTEPMRITVVGGPRDLRLPPGSTHIDPVPQRVLADIYAEHDILLKTSRVEGMYGPPLEAFHRGATAVTTPVTGHEEFIQHGWNALVTDWDDPDGTARLLDLLARDRRLLHFLRTNALATARSWPDWEQAGDLMAAALGAILARHDLPDPLRSFALFREARRFGMETAHRTHILKMKTVADAAHIDKLEAAWQAAEFRADDRQQALDAAVVALAADAEALHLQAEQMAALEAEINTRLDRRLLRFVRRVVARLRR